jgi:hypothetical protein
LEQFAIDHHHLKPEPTEEEFVITAWPGDPERLAQSL